MAPASDRASQRRVLENEVATNPALFAVEICGDIVSCAEIAQILHDGHIERNLALYDMAHAQTDLERSAISPSTQTWCNSQLASGAAWVTELIELPSREQAEQHLRSQLQGVGMQSFCYVLPHVAMYFQYLEGCDFTPSNAPDPERAQQQLLGPAGELNV